MFIKGDVLMCVKDSDFSYGPNVCKGQEYEFQAYRCKNESIVLAGQGGYSFPASLFVVADHVPTEGSDTMPDATTTLIAKLALLMPGYMNDLNEDANSPCLIEHGDGEFCIVPLTKEENDILQKAMQSSGIDDSCIITKPYKILNRSVNEYDAESEWGGSIGFGGWSGGW